MRNKKMVVSSSSSESPPSSPHSSDSFMDEISPKKVESPPIITFKRRGTGKATKPPSPPPLVNSTPEHSSTKSLNSTDSSFAKASSNPTEKSSSEVSKPIPKKVSHETLPKTAHETFPKRVSSHKEVSLQTIPEEDDEKILEWQTYKRRTKIKKSSSPLPPKSHDENQPASVSSAKKSVPDRDKNDEDKSKKDKPSIVLPIKKRSRDPSEGSFDTSNPKKKENISESGSFRCKFCNKGFSTGNAVSGHMRVHKDRGKKGVKPLPPPKGPSHDHKSASGDPTNPSKENDQTHFLDNKTAENVAVKENPEAVGKENAVKENDKDQAAEREVLIEENQMVPKNEGDEKGAIEENEGTKKEEVEKFEEAVGEMIEDADNVAAEEEGMENPGTTAEVEVEIKRYRVLDLNLPPSSEDE